MAVNLREAVWGDHRRKHVGDRTFVIAEAGVNHNGDASVAQRLIDEAANVGADAVKFQTFSTARLVSAGTSAAPYQRGSGASDQESMLKRLELPISTWGMLKSHAESLGLVFLSTPFDVESVHELASLGVEAFKIGSGDVDNHLLLRAVASYGRPVILSTGMSTLAEVVSAVDVLAGKGANRIALLHCTSAYPTPDASVNLRVMDTLRVIFGCPIGFSDHTEGITVALAAVARGATIIEKHFTLDRASVGPDHASSLEPDSFRRMVAGIRTVEMSLGQSNKVLMDVELENREVARRSLAAATNLAGGRIVAETDLIALRPAGGLSPAQLAQVIGRKLRRSVAEGDVLNWSHFE